MSTQKVFVFHPQRRSDLAAGVVEHFSATCVASQKQLVAALAKEPCKAVVLDLAVAEKLNLEYCATVLELPELKDIPVILFTQSDCLQDKLKALEIGCDDFIESSISCDEACARITKSIFHRIANEQISNRLELANQAALSAMVDNSDLGANLQFLLSVHDCDNLDQLGQQFFSTVERYGLKCSLQMRSVMGDKNMEAHGMAKDLEAQMLSQMAEAGRYVDFGKRTICNYDKVSLLIKNMPVDEPDKYGTIKDNTFCLVQGLNARIHALEDQYRMQQEKESLTKLSHDVNTVMHSLKDSYQGVMKEIVDQIESASNLIQERIPMLTLLEKDELFLETTLSDCIRETNRIFNEGLVVDEIFEKLENTVEKTLNSVSVPSAHQVDRFEHKKSDDSSGSAIELF